MTAKTKCIGITGGIGSGKSYVCRLFEQKGVPVYYADERAKALYYENKELKQALISLFGESVYRGNTLNRGYLAEKVFADAELLNRLNALVHPVVKKDFETWIEKQSTPYVLKEAAILIESGSYKTCDAVVLVRAPQKLRVQRVVQRDAVSETEVLQRIQKQMSDEEKLTFAHFVLDNDGEHDMQSEVDRLHLIFSEG
jgi:dephospho-CoA kinase